MSRCASLVSLSTLSVIALLTPGSAAAFTEDVCFGSGAPAACYEMGDCAQGDESAVCKGRAVTSAATNLGDGRSMVHFDATYLIARLVGFGTQPAYLIAAYDQATDLGQYVPLDANGDPMVSASSCRRLRSDPAACTGTTGTIDGLTRTNTSTGGTFLHLSMPYNPDGTDLVSDPDDQHPDVEDHEHEVLLANLREWVYAADPLCAGGLSDLSTGACWGASPYPTGELWGDVPVIGFTDGVPLSVDLGVQTVKTTGSVPSTAMALAVPAAHVEYARVGVYMHLLQDRISHYLCGNASVMYADPTSPDDVFADYSAAECDQPHHAIRHAWETGYAIDGEHEATRAALEMTWDELLDYASWKGVASSSASSAAYKAAWIDAIIANLEIADADARWTAMHDQRSSAGYAYAYSQYGY